MEFDLMKLPRMIDISAVRTDVTMDEINYMIEIAKLHNFVCVFTMPAFTKYAVEQLKDYPEIMVGGVVGFPSGADTTNIKVEQAMELKSVGVDELDMVINVTALKSGDYGYVYNDIKAIVDAADGTPVKAILEIAYLSDEEIEMGSKIAVDAGVTYVKTGTGWGPKPTTVHTIEVIKETIGDRALIKAAGGARTLDVVLDMIDAGCSRFGIGLNSALNILKEAYDREGKKMPTLDKEFSSKTDKY